METFTVEEVLLFDENKYARTPNKTNVSINYFYNICFNLISRYLSFNNIIIPKSISILHRKLRPEDLIQYAITEKKDKRVAKAHVNAVFFRQLRELLGNFNFESLEHLIDENAFKIKLS